MSQLKSLDPLNRKPYGVGVHWTTWTLPINGEPLPFPEAVARFDVIRFVRQVREMGAGHVLFTANHQLHWLAGPNPVVDGILPGRTCRRDLIGDLADELAAYDMPLILYYHHGCDGAHQDPVWYPAVGADRPGLEQFYSNLCNITGWMGNHYGKKIAAWWFDAGWWLLDRGNAPWQALAAAGKQGFDRRLICYNPGITSRNPMADVQDYWPGEAEGLATPPDAPVAPGGLPWYTFTTFHTLAAGGWGIDAATRHLPRVPPGATAIVDYVRAFQSRNGAVTLNCSVFQDGTIWPAEVSVMREVCDLMQSTAKS